MRTITRRFFFQLLGWAWTVPTAVLLRQMAQFLGYRPPAPDPTLVPLGTTASLPPRPVAIERARVFLRQDAAGFYALDNVCTHLGCLVRPQPNGEFACRCHGSRFTADGQVLTGPATVNLPYLELFWDHSGQLVVNRARRVDRSFRLPPRG